MFRERVEACRARVKDVSRGGVLARRKRNPRLVARGSLRCTISNRCYACMAMTLPAGSTPDTMASRRLPHAASAAAFSSAHV
jgi:hypothetical protein